MESESLRDAMKRCIDTLGMEYFTGLVRNVMDEYGAYTVSVDGRVIRIAEGEYTYLRTIWNNGTAVYAKNGANLMGKIAAIKVFREIYGGSLKGAKDALETMFGNR